MFVAWRDLRFAKGRFALMGAVIVLMTLLVGLLSGLTDGLRQQNISAITALPADHIAFQADTAGQSPSYSTSTVTQDQWQRWARVPGVERAEPLGITTTKAVAGDRGAAVSVFGVQAGSRLAPAGAGTAADSVVLTAAAAEDLAVADGDTLTIAGQTLHVVGVDGDAYFSHTPVVWTSLLTWRRLAPPSSNDAGPTATVVALTTTPAADLTAADQRIGTTTLSRADSLGAIGSYTSENGSLQLMRVFLFAISALVVGAFFTVWTIQRSRDVAILKALGASSTSLLRDALGQALVLLVGGTVIGTGMAVAAGVFASRSSAVPFVLTPSGVAVPALVIVLLGVLGAALSIRRITSIDPLIALGSTR